MDTRKFLRETANSNYVGLIEILQKNRIRIIIEKIMEKYAKHYHKEASKMKCPFCEKITEHSILDARCEEC